MKLSTLLLFATSVITITATPFPEANAVGESTLELDLDSTNVLTKRACSKNKCKCKKVPKNDQYCGWCSVVYDLGKGGDEDHIYECNPNGGCCDYGYANKCRDSNYDNIKCPS